MQPRASSTAASSMIFASRTASRVGRCIASELGSTAVDDRAATGGCCGCGCLMALLGPAVSGRLVATLRLALPPSFLGFLGRFLSTGCSLAPLQHTHKRRLRWEIELYHAASAADDG